MQPSPDILIQSLVDSGIVSQEDVTQISLSSESEPSSFDAAQSEPAEAMLQRLKELGSLTGFQLESLEQGGPDRLLLGDYILIDRLGAGGMGEVFRAIHRVMRREVAIKRLKTGVVQSPGLTQRFLREVRTAAKLVHPNIVTAYDAGEDDAGCYLVMEYVEGRDLSEMIRDQGPLSLERAVTYLLQAARGLAHAHQAGIIHRDVKPANFLVSTAGTLKLLDLGLARVEQQIAEAEDTAQLTITQADQLMGTLGYMAPEQAEDAHQASVAADLYALGCTFHHMVTGRPPFAGSSATKVLIAHREQAPPDLAGVLPPILSALYQGLLAKDPTDRPASADEVVRRLEQALASDALAIPVATSKHKAAKSHSQSKKGIRLYIGLAAAVLVIVSAIYFATRTPTPKSNAPQGDGAVATPVPDVLGTTTAAIQLQQAQAKQQDQPIDYENSIGMKFRFIPSARFRMGSTDEQVGWALRQVLAIGLSERYRPYIESEKPQAVVDVESPFYMAGTEVTVGQFRAFVNATGYKTLPESDGVGGIHFGKNESSPEVNWDNPGLVQNDRHPVVNITQSDAIAFCDWLSELEGRTYRLPREHEWEFACRAGNLGRWSFGDDQSQFFDYGWNYQTAPNGTQGVGQLKPNAFGLHDMHGNVREWVLLRTGEPADRFGVGVVRGGSFTKPAVLLRSASRVGFQSRSPYPYHGFRVLLEIE